MNHRIACVVSAAALLLLGTTLCVAADTAPPLPKLAASQAKASPKAKNSAAVKSKTAAKVKLVDINSASTAELKTLPGISDTEAAKIIAGRPYGSQAWLVTQKILDMAAYQQLKDLIVARQPSKDAAKNAALYSKKK